VTKHHPQAVACVDSGLPNFARLDICGCFKLERENLTSKEPDKKEYKKQSICTKIWLKNISVPLSYGRLVGAKPINIKTLNSTTTV